MCNTYFFLQERQGAGRPDREEQEGLQEPEQLEMIKTQPRSQQTGNSLGLVELGKETFALEVFGKPRLLYFDLVSDMPVATSTMKNENYLVNSLTLWRRGQFLFARGKMLPPDLPEAKIIEFRISCQHFSFPES